MLRRPRKATLVLLQGSRRVQIIGWQALLIKLLTSENRGFIWGGGAKRGNYLMIMDYWGRVPPCQSPSYGHVL